MEAVANLDTRQYVLFRLGKEEYGVDIQKVISIVRMMSITRVPKTPDFIEGVINLRGDIIPIINLRTKFKLNLIEETDDTRIIIIKIEEVTFGIIVDAVAEVLQLNEDSIENISNFSNDVSLDYILGVGKVGDRIVTLLHLEKLMEI